MNDVNRHWTPGNRHWTIDELVDRLYGVREADEHLAGCNLCLETLGEMKRQRGLAAASGAEAPVGLFAAQRAAVRDRIEVPERRLMRWAPAFTAACLVAAGVIVYHPAQAPPHPEAPAGVRQTDAQLFADIYSVEESSEPAAAAPIHELFEEAPQ